MLYYFEISGGGGGGGEILRNFLQAMPGWTEKNWT